MRRNTLAQRSILVIAALITATGLTASGASAEATGTITGILTAPDGAPVANASVYLDGPPPYMYAFTGDDGRYTITDVPPGSYRVRFQPQGRPSQYAYGKSEFSQAALIAVADGATVTVDETLLSVGHISGRLLKPDGSASASTQVSAIPVQGGVYIQTTTAADGTYSLAVFPGSYRVEFRLPGGFIQYAYGTVSFGSATIITVPGPDQTVTVNDTLLATGGIAGRLVDAGGTPMVNAEVQLSSNITYFTRTDPSGNYRFAHVAPGEYRVSVRNSLGMTMYAPRTPSWSQAQLYPITAGSETTLDLTFLPTGVLNGRFTSGGAGVAGVRVDISSEFAFASTMTNSNGEYQFGEAFGGNYRVRFEKTDAQPQIAQYAQGKVTYETANLFTLVPGSTLTVNDSQLAAGSLRVTARDSVTGAQIQEFSLDLNPFWGWTDNGVVTMNDLPKGSYKARIHAHGYSSSEERLVIINAGQQTGLEVFLEPEGKVSVTVVDRATGAPVEGICVFLVYKFHPTVPDGCDGTDQNGRMTLYAPSGDYTMMALPSGTNYGVQWVGPNGGTGDQREAAVISVVNGQTTTAPTIRLDLAGSIAGTVTSETGQPIGFGEVALLTVHAGVGSSGWGTGLNPDGSYRLEGLGPYQWPLLVWGSEHAYQWSGGKANRYEAQKVQVTSGGTATYNHVLRLGTAVLNGTMKDRDGTRMIGWLQAYDPVTYDYAGQAWISDNEPFVLRVLAPQQVKIFADGYWYGGASPQSADLLPLKAGTNTLNLCVVGPVTVVACGNITRMRPIPTDPPPGGTLPPQRPVPGIPPANPVPAPPGALPPVRR